MPVLEMLAAVTEEEDSIVKVLFESGGEIISMSVDGEEISYSAFERLYSLAERKIAEQT